jgi:hypothetical protein
VTWLFAALAVETGIAPSLLVAESDVMIQTMLAYIKKRNERLRRRR